MKEPFSLERAALMPRILVMLTLVVALFIVFPGEVRADTSSGNETGVSGEETEASPNEACLGCHREANQTMTFPNGDIASITVKEILFEGSVHGELPCTTCHINYEAYPHEEKDIESAREYAMRYHDSCKECHPETYEMVMDSVHEDMLESGNINAPTCGDCHDPHIQREIFGKGNSLALVERIWIPDTCAQCHNEIYEVYSESVHGSDLTTGQNFDVPSCIDCHSVHDIHDPRTAEFRTSSIDMCADCHTNPAIMDKYGISTEVMDTYVADFHGTTVTLFEKQHPDELTNKAVCYDCHGIHDIISVDDPEKGLHFQENLLHACQRCHPDATAAFPASWLSHYVPDPEHYPIVYYVELFYWKMMIPGVLGGMAVFVGSDFIRRLVRSWNRRRRARQQEAAPEEEDKKETEA